MSGTLRGFSLFINQLNLLKHPPYCLPYLPTLPLTWSGVCYVAMFMPTSSFFKSCNFPTLGLQHPSSTPTHTLVLIVGPTILFFEKEVLLI